MVTNFAVSHFYIIQSLRPDEPQTGRQLHDEVFKYRLFQLEGLQVELIDVHDLTAFRQALEQIARLGTSQGVRPFIHFEIHGNPEGLEIGNGEFISWKELYPYLVAINTCTKNNLFLTLATCYGAFIEETFDITNRAPFAWYIGPKDIITSDNAYQDYTVFFNELLISLDINTALAAMNDQHAHRPYHFSSAEKFYQETLRRWIAENSSLEKQLEKKEHLLKKIGNMGYPLSNEEIEKFVENELANMPASGKRAIDYFLFKSDVLIF